MTIHARSFYNPRNVVHVDLSGDDVFDVAIPLPSQPNRTVRATTIVLHAIGERVNYEVTRGPLLLLKTGRPGKQSLQTPVRLVPEQIPGRVRERALELAVEQGRRQANSLTSVLASVRAR